MSPQAIWYDWYGLNTQLFRLVNGWHAPLLDATMDAASTLGHPTLYPLYVAIALLWSRARPASLPATNVVVFAVGYLLTSAMAVPALKRAFDFPRPVKVLGEAAVTLVGRSDEMHAFPSGHAAFAVLIAASLAPGSTRPVRGALAAFALLVCASRISVGAHFPADVVGGALVALAIAALLHALLAERGVR